MPCLRTAAAAAATLCDCTTAYCTVHVYRALSLQQWLRLKAQLGLLLSCPTKSLSTTNLHCSEAEIQCWIWPASVIRKFSRSSKLASVSIVIAAVAVLTRCYCCCYCSLSVHTVLMLTCTTCVLIAVILLLPQRCSYETKDDALLMWIGVAVPRFDPVTLEPIPGASPQAYIVAGMMLNGEPHLIIHCLSMHSSSHLHTHHRSRFRRYNSGCR
jgi:hypothetical protein